jgi:hypothetical protein
VSYSELFSCIDSKYSNKQAIFRAEHKKCSEYDTSVTPQVGIFYIMCLMFCPRNMSSEHNSYSVWFCEGQTWAKHGTMSHACLSPCFGSTHRRLRLVIHVVRHIAGGRRCADSDCMATQQQQTNVLIEAHSDLVTDTAYDRYGQRLATSGLDHKCVLNQLSSSSSNDA